MAELVSLAEGVATLVHDGDTVALEGFTHLIPVAAGHEIIRQGRRDLTLVRMTPDIVYDQMIGAGCARAPGLLVGRQPGRRLAAPVPRRGRERLAAARWRSRSTATPAWPTGTWPARRGCPSPCCAATSAPTSPGTPRPCRTVTCPFTGEVLTAVRGAQPGRHGDPRPARRPAWQRAAVGHHRGAEGGGAGRAALAGDGGGGRRPARAAARRDRAAQPGWSRRSPRCPAAPTRRTRRATTTATTTTTGPGTRSAATATPSGPGWTRPCSRAARDELDGRRDDDGDRRAGADRPGLLLRRDRPAEHRGQPGPPHRRAGPRPHLRVRDDRRQARPGCPCPSATASWPTTADAVVSCRRSSTTGSSPAGSTSASSAPRRSTGSATSTRP